MTKYTTEDADRLLGLADQFLEDWEEDERESPDATDNLSAERRQEWDEYRPLFVAAPLLLEALEAMLRRADLHSDSEVEEARAAIAAVKWKDDGEPNTVPDVNDFDEVE